MNDPRKDENREYRNGRFDWIVSDWTIGLALIVLVTPAIVHGVLSLNNLPVV